MIIKTLQIFLYCYKLSFFNQQTFACYKLQKKNKFERYSEPYFLYNIFQNYITFIVLLIRLL